MSDEKQEPLEDSGEELLAQLRAQRALSKSGVEALKATRFAQQQSVQARTLRTQAVLDKLREEDEEEEARKEREAEEARKLPPTERLNGDKV